VPNSGDGTLVRLDPATNQVVATIDTGSTPLGLPSSVSSPGIGGPAIAAAAAGNQVWVSRVVNTAPPEWAALRIDPATNTVAQVIPLEVQPWVLALSSDALWITSKLQGRVVRIDTATAQVVASIDVPAADQIAINEHGVWVSSLDLNNQDDLGAWNPYGAPFITRIDPATNAVVETIPFEVGITGIAAGEGALWVCSFWNDTVWRLDPQTGETVAEIALGDPQSLAAGDGAVWVNRPATKIITRIDPATNEPAVNYQGGSYWGFIAVGEGVVWVAELQSGKVARIDP
jgi:YVTN family beta-propeller protein